jgi:hypothetical protein
MAFTLAQKLDYYRRNPHLRARLQRRWRAGKRRAAEIAAAKAVLMSAHRLRAIGVSPR